MTLLIVGVYLIGLVVFWVNASRAAVNSDLCNSNDQIDRIMIIGIMLILAPLWPVMAVVWMMNNYLKENENGS